jgi:phosphatidylglycerophosphatase A
MTLQRLIASGFGCGFVPLAPGTVASAVTLLPGALLQRVSPALLPLVVVLVIFAGLWAIRAAHVDGDPGWVVVDEVAGQLLAVYGLAHVSVLGILSAFLIFRILDIAKPGPIGWADRQGGAAGIMADDVIAGAVTAGILWAIGSHWPALLGRF